MQPHWKSIFGNFVNTFPKTTLSISLVLLRLDSALKYMINIISIPGYSVIRQDRNTQGGGILLLIKESLNTKILCSLNTQQIGKLFKYEYIFCSVWEDNSTPTLVTLVYRLPMSTSGLIVTLSNYYILIVLIPVIR